uniref:Gag-pol n=1 Tax=Oryza sativa subsp. japonica TaxID=39947 RepID=Q6F3C3_ORYSJ|nr:putative gag-pol precursor [Oryza sativa Japonica Group]
MGFVSGIDDCAFLPGQAFRFGSLNFITNDFGKISLLDSDSNQLGRDQVLVPFGIPNSAEAYSKIISPKSASNHSDEIQSTLPRPDQDDGSYPSILMKLPDDLAAVFTVKTSPTRRSRRAPASAPIQSRSREVGVILQPLGTVSTEELDGYLSSPGVSSRPTEILDYNDFGYHYDHGDLDNFDDSSEDNYTPLFFGVFMADNEMEEQRQAREADQDRARQEAEPVFRTPQQNAVAAITLLDTLLKEDTLNQADHVVNILNQTKTMIAASVPANSASTRTPTSSRVPHFRSHDYHQPSLSIIGTGSSRRSRGHDERSFHSPPERHRERRAKRPHSPPHQRPVDLRDMINQRRAARGHRHSPNRYDDDVDGVAAFTNDLRRVDWPASFKPTGIEKYDGTTNPESWLTVYGLAIRAAGGDSKAMANYLPVALADSAQSWLNGLPRGTIGSWAELRDHFIANFQGTFERPGTQFDLYNVVQKSGESLRDYIRRFSEQRNKISDITDDVIIAAFTKGIRHEDLVGKFGCKPPRTVKQMFEKANEYAKAEDAITASKQSGTTWKPKKDTPTAGGSGSNNHKDRKRLSATPLGQITLLVTFGTGENFRTKNVCFEVADFETAYHAILGRPALAKFMAVPHYTYMMMKMPGPRGVISLRSDIKQAVTCDKESCEIAQTHETILAREEIRLAATTTSEGEVPATKLTKTEESDAKTKKIPLDPSDPDKTAEDAKPIKQRLRRFAQDRKDAIKEELTKLLAAGFIKEVLHPDWLANPVLVRKKTGQWRMCVDYTDLNKSCPKDPFGLPRIDQIGRNVEAYVDDVVVKTKQKDDLIADLEETFTSIRAFRMKLNPEKCIFRVPSGKLLGFMVVSTVLVVEREEEGHIQKVQRPIYFVSEVLADSKTSHSVTVVTSFPLGDILHNHEANGRIAKWALELMSLNISFKPRTSIKSQALADFLAEWTECQENMPEEKMEYWTMHFDGSKRLTGTGAGVVLISPTGERLSYVLWIHFSASHNVAEYEALLHGLRIAISLGIRRLIVRGDSQLVVNQVMKEWSCLDDNMTAYRQEVRKLENKFDGLELTHVLRHNNEAADRLANFGSKREAAPSDVFVEHLYKPTVPRKETVEAMDAQGVSMIEADWREPFIKFLSKQELPQDKNEAERISRRSRLYIIHETELYKKSPSGILQRCVSLEEGRQLLKDIHSGICGNHAAARTIVGKAYRQGFFWPTAVSDADKIPFAVCGLDMVGPFKRAVGGYTHLFVAIDKFSKWIEAKPVITITADKARDFFINIVHRFGVPNRIITDNGTQFTGGAFQDFCEDFSIKICYASVAHPMSNGQVERANGMILQGIKARVFDRLRPYAGKWVDQLSSVLWSLRTTPSRATGQSPFFLVYGAEAMLPSEVEFESLRFRNFNEEGYEEGRVDDINRLEEAREAALIQSTRYLQGLRRYHNRNVRSRAFLVGDLVMRKIQTIQDRHKLSPLWEGPFIIAEVTRPGSYRLKREDGTLINNSWNIEHLRRFYA